ncbi:MAG: hypothetical protein ACF8PN_01645 [Phycisphaerales bacterium]
MMHATPSGRDLRDRGAAGIEAKSYVASLQIRRVFLKLLLQHHPAPVDFDLVRKVVKLPDGVHFNVFGAAALWCLQAGLAIPVGLTQSKRPTARMAKMRKWIIADQKRVRHWVETYDDLELPEDPQMQLFAEGGAP